MIDPFFLNESMHYYVSKNKKLASTRGTCPSQHRRVSSTATKLMPPARAHERTAIMHALHTARLRGVRTNEMEHIYAYQYIISCSQCNQPSVGGGMDTKERSPLRATAHHASSTGRTGEGRSGSWEKTLPIERWRWLNRPAIQPPTFKGGRAIGRSTWSDGKRSSMMCTGPILFADDSTSFLLQVRRMWISLTTSSSQQSSGLGQVMSVSAYIFNYIVLVSHI